MRRELLSLLAHRPSPIWLWLALVASGAALGAAISWLTLRAAGPGLVIGGLAGVMAFVAIKLKRIRSHA